MSVGNCPTCEGMGFQARSLVNGFGIPYTVKTACPDCLGTGSIPKGTP